MNPRPSSRLSSNRRLILCTTFLMPALSWAADWNTTTGLFSDPNSWNPSGVPVAPTDANILNGGTAQIVDGDTFGVGVFNVGGQAGVGTVTQSGGSITATQVIIGGSDVNGSSGVGTYTMTGGSLTGSGASREMWIGSRGGTGTVNMSGSAAISNIDAWLVIGRDTGGTANVNMSGSSSISQIGGGNLAIGVNTGTTSTVTMGGTSSLSTSNELRVGFIGGAGTTGVLNMNDSSTATSTGNLWVGLQSAGQMTLSNNASATGAIVVVGGDGGGNGALTVNDNATLTANNDLLVSWNGANGVYTQNGGTVVTNPFAGIDNTGASVTLNGGNGTNAIVNLNGGTISATGFNKASNSATLNLNGAVIKITGNTNTGSYLNGFANNEVNVQAGGAKFDTNGNDIVIVQDLAGAGGFVKQGTGSLLLVGNTNYAGDTRVEGGALSFSFASINDSSSVYISTGGILDLSTGGLTDSISILYFNGVAQAAGVWGAIGSGAQFQSSFITGDGFLSVASVPEPGTVGLLVLGGLGFFLARRGKY